MLLDDHRTYEKLKKVPTSSYRIKVIDCLIHLETAPLTG